MEARNVYCFDVKENLGMDDDQKKFLKKKREKLFPLVLRKWNFCL